MITIIKRDGRESTYDAGKVITSVLNAAKSANQRIIVLKTKKEISFD